MDKAYELWKRSSQAQAMLTTVEKYFRRKYNINSAQLAILLRCRYTPGITLSDIAQSINMDLTYMSRQSTLLATKGLLQKQASTDDKRALSLTLTDKGLRLMDQFLREDLQPFVAKLDELGEENVMRIIEGIGDFVQVLNEHIGCM